MTETAYRGRFAPSPTGPLHFGSLVAAVASYADALAHQGSWRVRIDDLDQTRCIADMDRTILLALEQFGFCWHGAVSYQSHNTVAYQEALQQLQQAGLTYSCVCSRSEIKKIARIGIEGPVYPDTCRNAGHADLPQRAVRVRTSDQPVCFTDRACGQQTQRIHQEIGDFVVRRADGYFAYQLAVVVDDHLSDITQVVRGADLLHSSARQIFLQQCLGYASPDYLHVPLVYGSDGKKLSKSDQAHPVDPSKPLNGLLAAWAFLDQLAPPDCDSVEAFWRWAADNWQVKRIGKTCGTET